MFGMNKRAYMYMQVLIWATLMAIRLVSYDQSTFQVNLMHCSLLEEIQYMGQSFIKVTHVFCKN